VIRLAVKEFHGLQDDLKISETHLTPGRYPVQKICPPKKNGVLFSRAVSARSL